MKASTLDTEVHPTTVADGKSQRAGRLATGSQQGMKESVYTVWGVVQHRVYGYRVWGSAGLTNVYMELATSARCFAPC